MAITYGNLSLMVQNTLQDVEGGLYPPELIYNGICGAIDAILPWAPKQNVIDVVGDGVINIFPISNATTDVYRIEAAQELSTGYFSEKMLLNPSSARKVNGTYAKRNWLEYPRGNVRFSDALEEGETYRVYFQQHYAKPSGPTDADFSIEIPTATIFGVIYWACAHCVVPGSLINAQIRQFNQRIDSGVPTDNALGEQAKVLRSLFLDEMNRVPKLPGVMS